MKIINLTPHRIHFVDSENEVFLTVESSGIARVAAKTVRTGRNIAGIPVSETVYGDVENLPDPQEGVVYVVSALVAQCCKDRDDVYIPGEQVRDEDGRVIGCRSLGR